MNQLLKLLPFLKKEQLEDLLKKVMSNEDHVYKGISVKDILVYLPQEKIDELFLDDLHNSKEINFYFPFVSKKTLENIVELICIEQFPYKIDFNILAMFLDDEQIKQLYTYFTK